MGLRLSAGARQAIEATKSLNDDKLADYIRKTTFQTVVGDVKFGEHGEWAQERMLPVQFQNIKGNSIDEFRDFKTEVDRLSAGVQVAAR